MVLSAPFSDSLEIIALYPVKKLRGINPMELSAPRDESLEIIVLQPVFFFEGLTQWAL